MANRRNYIFTNHLRERFVERTNKKFSHLQNCKQDDCDLCRNLAMEIKEILEVQKPVDQEIARRVNAAVESKAYLNDAHFMKWYYEKYGFDRRFEFLVHEDIVFVVVEKKSHKVIVTCLRAKTHIAALPTLRPKFNGIKRQREEKMLRALDNLPTGH